MLFDRQSNAGSGGEKSAENDSRCRGEGPWEKTNSLDDWATDDVDAEEERMRREVWGRYRDATLEFSSRVKNKNSGIRFRNETLELPRLINFLLKGEGKRKKIAVKCLIVFLFSIFRKQQF